MSDLADGESIEVQGSARKPYVLTNTGGVYACSCPAWRHQSLPIEKRSCKHLRKLRGDEAEAERTGGASPPRRVKKAGSDETDKPALLLAHRWENDRDLTGWWMSEKLDGVRAYWNGETFISRLGNAYMAPKWFTEGLPKTPLDGELWAGRQLFQKTVSVVRRSDKSKLWEEIKYLVFDAPDHEGVFETRLEHVHQELGDHPYASRVDHEACQGLEHLQRELERVEGLGGEGLMLRQPKSSYVQGRSTTLLKVKTFFDAEAKVIGYQDGRGRHKGRVGSLLAVSSTGVEFSIGTGLSDKEREQPPGVGAIVTYRYQELTDAGVPRFPSYVGERHDVAWEEIEVSSKRKAGASPLKAGAKKKKKKKTTAKHAKKTSAKPAATKKPAAKTKAATTGGGTARCFEFTSGASSKFWEIRVEGDSHTVRYGRIGTDGQSKTKDFADSDQAQASAEKLVAQKLKKGYTETG